MVRIFMMKVDEDVVMLIIEGIVTQLRTLRLAFSNQKLEVAFSQMRWVWENPYRFWRSLQRLLMLRHVGHVKRCPARQTATHWNTVLKQH
jgi:hypothetical protein